MLVVSLLLFVFMFPLSYLHDAYFETINKANIVQSGPLFFLNIVKVIECFWKHFSTSLAKNLRETSPKEGRFNKKKCIPLYFLMHAFSGGLFSFQLPKPSA